MRSLCPGAIIGLGWCVIGVMIVQLAGCGSSQPAKSAAIRRIPKAVTPEVRGYFGEAMQAAELGELEKATGLLNTVIRHADDNPVPFINLALIYLKLDDYKLAEINFKRALDLDPDNPVANNEYAMLLRRTGRVLQARTVYEKTLQKYPGHVRAHKNLGILCEVYLKDYKCAHEHYLAYGKFRPDDADVKSWMAGLSK